MSVLLRGAFQKRLIIVATLLGVAGCTAPNVTGRTLTERTIAALTGKDYCQLVATLFRNGASFCETPTNSKLASANLDPDLLGFAPVDRRAAADFSLEIARKESAGIDAPMLAFGMVSASNLPSYSYRLKLRADTSTKAEKLAMADTPNLRLRPGH